MSASSRGARSKGEDLAPKALTELEVSIRGVFEPRRLLDLIRYFVVFESDGDTVIKKMAGYHQFHAVGRAIDATVTASRPSGSRRVGVVWHTQGSGKSLTMAFYAGRVVLHPAMQNPTLIVLTDRNDLDEQLFCTFARCKELLRQSPEQARDRAHLRELLEVAAGGVVFTTVQEFLPETRGDAFPLLSARENIVVIADKTRSRHNLVQARSFAELLEKSVRRYQNRAIEAAQVIEELIEHDARSRHSVQARRSGSTSASSRTCSARPHHSLEMVLDLGSRV